MTDWTEGKNSPYARRLGEYTAAAMRDRHKYRAQRDKLRAVIDACYEEVHYINHLGYFEADEWDKERVLEKVEELIENLTEDDWTG